MPKNEPIAQPSVARKQDLQRFFSLEIDGVNGRENNICSRSGTPNPASKTTVCTQTTILLGDLMRPRCELIKLKWVKERI